MPEDFEEFYTDQTVIAIIKKITIDLTELKFVSTTYDNSFFTRYMPIDRSGDYRSEYSLEILSDTIKIENESGYNIGTIPILEDCWEDCWDYFITKERPIIKKWYRDD